MRDPAAGLSQQSGEAEGGLIPELRERMGAALTKLRRVRTVGSRGRGEQGGHRRNSSEPVVEPPQAMKTGSNPIDMGRAVVRGEPANPGEPISGGQAPSLIRGERLRCDRRARPTGEKLGARSTNRSAVNVGTVPVSAWSPAGDGSGAASAEDTGRGGASVVVGAGESPARGEGRQWACGSAAGRRGGRR